MTTTREAQLLSALIEIDNAPGPDHWVPQFQNVKDIAAEALSTPATEPQGYVEGLANIDGQVFTAAKDMGSSGRENPEWAFIDYEANRMSFGRWAKCGDNPAPYIRADLVLDALASRPSPQPAAWAWDADGFLQPAADTRVVVKPLVWRFFDVNHRFGKGVYDANAVRHTYTILDCVDKPEVGPRYYVECISASFADLDDAKTAVQDDHDKRILSAIIDNATPAPSDKIAEAALTTVLDWADEILTDTDPDDDDSFYMDNPRECAEAIAFDSGRQQVIAAIASLRALAGQGETP